MPVPALLSRPDLERLLVADRSERRRDELSRDVFTVRNGYDLVGHRRPLYSGQ